MSGISLTYRTRNPRADLLRENVCDLKTGSNRIAFAEVMDRDVLDALSDQSPDRHLGNNVEFYTALVMDGIVLPRDLFPPKFTMVRVIGWCGHNRGMSVHCLTALPN